MYAIDIAASKFQGTSIVKQHRMVNEILKEEIKGMHGLQVLYHKKEQFLNYWQNTIVEDNSKIEANYSIDWKFQNKYHY